MESNCPPRVSVIINCFNGERYLIDAIESVYAQTYSNWEIIFWDNQSTDASAEIAQRFDDRLRYFRGGEFLPLGPARNMAIQKARGEFIAILDCDDIWYPEKLACQVAAADANPDAGVIYSNCSIIGSDGSLRKPARRPARVFNGRVFEPLITQAFTVAWPTMFCRIRCLRQVGLFRGYKQLHDLDVLLLLAEEFEFVHVDRILAAYRVHPNQLSQNYRVILDETLDIYDFWKRRWENNGILTSENLQVLATARARAYTIAGRNAAYQDDWSVRYYMASLHERFSVHAALGFLLSLLGPQVTSRSISSVRRLLGHGEYY